MTRVLAAALCVVCACASAGLALAAEPRITPRPQLEPSSRGRSWHDEKCARYRDAWAAAIQHLGTRGLGERFLAAHEAYLASNCTRPADVCPRSSEELRLANVMVELSMNFGAASTFAPFACR